MTDCAICLSKDGFDCESSGMGGRDGTLFDCPVCGKFSVSRNALNEHLSPENENLDRLKRATLSHRTRLKFELGDETAMLMTYDIERFLESTPKLPNPSQQAMNAIRFIGDAVQRDFIPMKALPPNFQASIGAPTRHYSLKLVRDLMNRGLVSAIDSETLSNPYDVIQVDLGFLGWEAYDQEQSGKFSSSYGFIALKYGDTILDPFLAEKIKPGIRAIGYELLDLRDVSQAGVIDNILRAQIRDAAFVLVDLTHDNPGAYWEAGYAEGLGKPVIYICERTKFDEKRTHFDTNHCTTVMWDLDNPDHFLTELSATIRRSLGF